MSRQALLGGYPLARNEVIGWELRSGGEPYMRAFTLPANEARALILASGATAVAPAPSAGQAAGRAPGAQVGTGTTTTAGGGNLRTPFTARLQTQIRPGTPTQAFIKLSFDGIEVKRLIAIDLEPTDHPDLLRVVIADRRWLWRYFWVAADYNVRLRTGDTRELGQRGEAAAFQQLADHEKYLARSLNGGARLRPTEILGDVLQRHLGEDDAILETARGTLDRLVVENLALNDPGNAAIERMSSIIPGLRIYLDLEGRVRVHLRQDRNRELGLINRFGPPARRTPLLFQADRRNRRPSVTRVHFHADMELRLSVLSGSGLASTATTPRGGPFDDLFTLTNVAPVPDASLDIPGRGRVLRGTWVTFRELFAGWAAAPRGTLFNAWSDAEVRSMILAPGALQGLAGGTFDRIQMERVATVIAHYRQTWQMNKSLREALVSWRPQRVGVIDFTTGRPARSQVYANYVIFYTEWGKTRMDPWAENVREFTLDATQYAGTSSPFEVSVVDHDIGILRVSPRMDNLGYIANAFIGQGQSRNLFASNAAALPSLDVTKLRATGPGVTIDSYQLDDTVEFSLYITGQFGTPNDARRYHVTEIGASDPDIVSAFGTVNVGAQPEDVYVPWGPATSAWFPWIDTESQHIVNAVNDQTTAPHQGRDPSNLIPVVRPIAVAEAIRNTERRLDRHRGVHVQLLDEKVNPAGGVGSVLHSREPDGRPTTTVSFPDEVEPLPFETFLPQQLRERVAASLYALPPEV